MDSSKRASDDIDLGRGARRAPVNASAFRFFFAGVVRRALVSSAGRFDAGAGAAAAAAAARPSSASAADASGGLGFGAGGRRFSRTTLHNLSGSSRVKCGCTNRAVRAWSGATARLVPLSMLNCRGSSCA